MTRAPFRLLFGLPLLGGGGTGGSGAAMGFAGAREDDLGDGEDTRAYARIHSA